MLEKIVDSVRGTLLFLSVPIVAVHGQSGDLIWVATIGGTGFSEVNSVALDDMGNVHLTGRFQGTVDFDPGPEVVELTSAGGAEVFVLKLNPDGDFIWARAMGGEMEDIGYGIAVDNEGNVLTTGYFEGTADFDPGPGTFNLRSNGSNDIFVSKLDSSGNLVWAHGFGDTIFDRGQAIATDAAGNVYTTGFFWNTVDFDPGPETVTLMAPFGAADVFIQKLSPDGELVWARGIGGPGGETGESIALDRWGNIYLSGGFTETTDFDPGPENFEVASMGDFDYYVLKLDPSGEFIWARTAGGLGDERAFDFALDPMGNVYMVGPFEGTVDFDPGDGVFSLDSAGLSDVGVMKLDADGEFLWARSFGGPSFITSRGCALDGDGHLFLTGFFAGQADFDPGPGDSPLASNGGNDIYVLKLDSEGDFEWAASFGGTTGDEGVDVAVDSSGNVHAVGRFRSVTDFDPGEGTEEVSPVGSADGFVLKLTGTPSVCTLMGDITNDGRVDSLDLIKLTAGWNADGTGGFDVILDGDVNAIDVLQIIQEWGLECGVE